MKHKAFLVLLIVAAFGLAMMPGEVEAQTSFLAHIDWQDIDDFEAVEVTLTVRTRAFQGGPILDQVPMNAGAEAQIQEYTVAFTPNSQTTIWEVIASNTQILPQVIVDGDEINWNNQNNLDDDFYYIEW